MPSPADFAAAADATSDSGTGVAVMTAPLTPSASARERARDLSSGHQRAASALACASQEAANQMTVLAASGPYCTRGSLPSGAGSGWAAPAESSLAQSGGRSLPFLLSWPVRVTALTARRCHTLLPVSRARLSIAGSDQ